MTTHSVIASAAITPAEPQSSHHRRWLCHAVRVSLKIGVFLGSVANLRSPLGRQLRLNFLSESFSAVARGLPGLAK
jgi:hypothetical protein